MRFIETENSGEPAIHTNVFALWVCRDADTNWNDVEESFEFTGAVVERGLQASNFGFESPDSLAVCAASSSVGR